MAHRDRAKRSARLGNENPPKIAKKQVLVATEGLVTERIYLNSFSQWLGDPDIKCRIIPVGGVPMTVVKKARELRNHAIDKSSHSNDQVWAVFDTDDHARLKDAIQMALDNGIRVALSNPCFELWLLLHFQDNPGMQGRAQIASMVRQHIPRYKKAIRFNQCQAGYDEAVRRAARLYEQAELDGEPYRNPVTGVHLLTEEIRGG